MSGPLRQQGKALLLDVRVTPKASRNEVAGIRLAADGAAALTVKVTAVPEKGKANAAVVATLAKAMKLAPSTFAQVAGDTNRNKTFEITGNSAAVEAFIAALTDKQQQGTENGEDH